MRLLNNQKIVSAALLVILTAICAADAQGQSILGEILRRLDTHNKSLQSLRAEVTMVKHNPQLNVSDTTSGTTSYLPKTPKRGMYVRIDWTKPVEEQISVIGDDYELYRPRLNQVIVGKVQKAKNNASVGGALAFMSMTRDQLRANYDVRYIGEEQIRGGTPTWRLELTPKTETSYKMAELWVDGDGMPRQAKIVEHNNDSTTVLLTNIQKNLTLKGDIFKLKYPANVKKIKA
ncbi:MAG: outer membrane lipoprotein carrier protein LolA [Acidobacteria bacterium]|nr:outer membrane lipoprotein carrier protein LolA [Acidobacteriota bacterium]